ncbi:hypothetical protein [Streptosporangium sp. LJ11]|uniref:hypothetical protein n=1 Tax=Streptosporangium sp. LJ11 TaxID=3436927 RepID=UPI003F7975EA
MRLYSELTARARIGNAALELFDSEGVTRVRPRRAGMPCGSRPTEPGNGRIGHPLCPRGLFFVDAARNLYEVTSPA